jgi:hypothetical protein
MRLFVLAVAFIFSAATTFAAEPAFRFENGAAFVGWRTMADQSSAPMPHPAPFVVVDGVRYRLGDAGVQFHRYDAGGVQVILGACAPQDAKRVLATEYYTSGAFSELFDCDAIDGNHAAE